MAVDMAFRRSKDVPAGHELSGKISDRIRGGKINAEVNPARITAQPKADSVRHGSGQSVGRGSRSDKS
jgi:hypothetical protein